VIIMLNAVEGVKDTGTQLITEVKQRCARIVFRGVTK
jgi:hypothetical protein